MVYDLVVLDRAAMDNKELWHTHQSYMKYWQECDKMRNYFKPWYQIIWALNKLYTWQLASVSSDAGRAQALIWIILLYNERLRLKLWQLKLDMEACLASRDHQDLGSFR